MFMPAALFTSHVQIIVHEKCIMLASQMSWECLAPGHDMAKEIYHTINLSSSSNQ